MFNFIELICSTCGAANLTRVSLIRQAMENYWIDVNEISRSAALSSEHYETTGR